MKAKDLIPKYGKKDRTSLKGCIIQKVYVSNEAKKVLLNILRRVSGSANAHGRHLLR